MQLSCTCVVSWSCRRGFPHWPSC
ncbi:TPA: hypothetical protein RR030_003562 [Vibrio cholerae]|nr:hypothetical protein [Vibrio cholerae]HDZ2388078.1 hypothetical protein [Vibrio cholerae]